MTQPRLEIVPINFDEAKAFVSQHHRHHNPPLSHKFSLAVSDGDTIRGVAIVGRPVARGADDGWTLEVTRLASDGCDNACSCLYRAAWRVARAMGYRRLITYILDSETGTSLVAAGFKNLGEVKGRSWDCPSRPRVDKHPTQGKFRFEVTA